MEREDDQTWEVEIAGRLGHGRGELEVVVDGWDGRVLAVRDKHKRHEHGDDDDDQGEDD